MMRPAFFVPESRNAVELLHEMRARRLPFGIVLDEHGGMSGIVTLEDLVEELVGEIFSEHERDAGQSIRPDADGSLLVDAALTIREVNRGLEVELPDDGSWSTLAGLVLALAKRMPKTGEKFSLPSGVVLEVVDASPRRIRTVRVRPVP